MSELREILELDKLLELLIATIETKVNLGMVEGELDTNALSKLNFDEVADSLVDSFREGMGEDLTEKYIYAVKSAKGLFVVLLESLCERLETELILSPKEVH